MTKSYKIHEHGLVALVETFGTDESIVEAARVSYRSTTKPPNTVILINNLIKNQHKSPFEMVELKFRIHLPIFVARQMIRHRTANVNEVSGRYSELEHKLFKYPIHTSLFDTEVERWLVALSNDKKRCRLLPKELYDKWNKLADDAFTVYEELLQNGLPREMARIHLPLSTYTSWVWKMDLSNLFHFLRLRLDKHAQKEIRDYAFAILVLTFQAFPIAVKAFGEHILGWDSHINQDLHLLTKQDTSQNIEDWSRIQETITFSIPDIMKW